MGLALLRAHVKRRQRNRTLTIVAALAIVAISLIAGLYVALNSKNSALDVRIGQPADPSDMSRLYQLAHAPYGPSGASLLTSSVLKNATGPPYVSNGKPVVVYIGADYCPFCAIERWSMIIALSRFGNFSGLHYMTASEGDYATFTFKGSTYVSNFVVFQPFEQRDRNQVVQETVPSTYLTEFSGGYPFLNFGNQYLLTASLLGHPEILGTKNWTQIMTSIASGDDVGRQISMAANAITALICKVTHDVPSAAVCGHDPIPSTTANLSFTQSWPPSASYLSLSSFFAVPSRQYAS